MNLGRASSLHVLRSVNYIDSSVLGMHIDIFKIRLLISVRQSYSLRDFGFEDGCGYLSVNFRQIRNLELIFKKFSFSPPYLEDGELAAADLMNFDFESLAIERVGSTGETDRFGEYGDLQDVFEVCFIFREGTLKFQFVNIDVSFFDPIDFRLPEE